MSDDAGVHKTQRGGDGRVRDRSRKMKANPQGAGLFLERRLKRPFADEDEDEG